MKVYIMVVVAAVALVVLSYGGTWIEGSQRKYCLGRLTFWFPHLVLRSLFSWRFYRLVTHHTVVGDVTRGSWGPVAFNLNPRDIE